MYLGRASCFTPSPSPLPPVLSLQVFVGAEDTFNFECPAVKQDQSLKMQRPLQSNWVANGVYPLLRSSMTAVETQEAVLHDAVCLYPFKVRVLLFSLAQICGESPRTSVKCTMTTSCR